MSTSPIRVEPTQVAPQLYAALQLLHEDSVRFENETEVNFNKVHLRQDAALEQLIETTADIISTINSDGVATRSQISTSTGILKLAIEHNEDSTEAAINSNGILVKNAVSTSGADVKAAVVASGTDVKTAVTTSGDSVKAAVTASGTDVKAAVAKLETSNTAGLTALTAEVAKLVASGVRQEALLTQIELNTRPQTNVS